MKKIFIALSVLFLSVQAGYADIVTPGVPHTRTRIRMIIDKTGKPASLKIQPFDIREARNVTAETYSKKNEQGIDKCGYKYSNGDIMTDAVFDRCYDFIRSYASVSYGGKWGLIDTKGNYVLPPEFDDFIDYNEKLDLAVVKQNHRYGVINKNGKWIAAPEYGRIFNYSDGLAIACRLGSCFYIDKDGKTALELKSKKLQPLFYDNESRSDFSEGLAAVLDGDSNIVYIDKDGNDKIITKYKTAEKFSEGLAAVSDGRLWGYIDKTGKCVIEPRFVYAGNFKNGRAEVIYLNDRLKDSRKTILHDRRKTNLSGAAFADEIPYGNYENNLHADKKQPMKIFSIVLLVLVIIAGISMRRTGKKS